MKKLGWFEDRINMSLRPRSGSLALDSGVSDKSDKGRNSPLLLASAQFGKCPEPSGSGPNSAVSSSRSVQHPTSSERASGYT